MTTPGTDLRLLRRAALRVHAMPEPDAAWLLAALAAEHRAALEPLLRELQALGIARDPVLARDAGAHAPKRAVHMSVPEPVAGPVPFLERLDRSGLAALETVLRAEPRAVTIQLLAVQPWPWAGRIARKLHAAGEEGPPPNAALLTALLRAIEVQLAACRVQRWHRMRAWCASTWKRLGARRIS